MIECISKKAFLKRVGIFFCTDFKLQVLSSEVNHNFAMINGRLLQVCIFETFMFSVYLEAIIAQGIFHCYNQKLNGSFSTYRLTSS